MTRALQIKLLVAILAVLGVIAGLLGRGGRQITVTEQDRKLQQTFNRKIQPSEHRYLVP